MQRYSTTAARLLFAGVLIALAGTAAAQQPAYPGKPIRLIVPYPPGGSNNVLARLIGQKLAESMAQPVNVDNRPGGNTVIGSEALVKSAPDGYTLMLTSTTHVINPNLYNLPYDAVRDFTLVGTIAYTDELLVVHPSIPASNLKEFIALAKAKPGQLNYSSSGGGNLNHLAAALFSIMTGVKMQHIPYKGGGPALTDIIAGQVQLGFQVPVNVIPHIKSGRIKALAITGEARLPSLPQVPTFAEAGLPGFEARAWFGVFAPAGTPKGIVDKLSNEIMRVLAMPDIKEKLASQGLIPFISTPEQFTALVKADMARYGKVIKAANIKAEN